MDADGSHQPEQLDRLLDALRDGADLVIGSRWVPGGSVVNWPLRRELLSRGGNLYVRLLLGVKVRDATAGFRLFRRTTLEKIDLDVGGVDRLRLPDRHGRAHPARPGSTVREVPIEFVERVRGDSKMSGAVATESLKRITAWGLRERTAPGAQGAVADEGARPMTRRRRLVAGRAVRRLRRGAAGRDLRARPGRPGDRRRLDDRPAAPRRASSAPG